MDLILKRDQYRSDGIFSHVTDAIGNQIMVTCDHAYDDGQGNWLPKVAPGIYTCVRGTHALSDGIPFETFEVTGVEGHSGILFHPGNTEMASHGCFCTGQDIAEFGSAQGVTHSRDTFAHFMKLQTGINQFQLTVEA